MEHGREEHEGGKLHESTSPSSVGVGVAGTAPEGVGDTGEPKAEQYRKRAAEALERSAQKVRQWGEGAPGGERTTKLGEQAGGGMNRASDYLRSHTVDDISGEMQTWVKQNPGPAIACAAAFGFLAGVAMRRR